MHHNACILFIDPFQVNVFFFQMENCYPWRNGWLFKNAGYLRVSNNNRAETVRDAFLEACEKYFVPWRVGADKGGENIQVAEYMLQRGGCGRRSFIVGRSVHNQRCFMLEQLRSCTNSKVFYIRFRLFDL